MFFQNIKYLKQKVKKIEYTILKYFLTFFERSGVILKKPFLKLENFFRLIKIKEWVDKNDPGASLIPFSGAFENKAIDMEEADRAKYFEESKVTRYRKRIQFTFCLFLPFFYLLFISLIFIYFLFNFLILFYLLIINST